MTYVSMTTVTDPSSVNTESAGVEDAESSPGGKPAQPEPDKDLTAEEEALLLRSLLRCSDRAVAQAPQVHRPTTAAGSAAATAPANAEGCTSKPV